MLPVVPGHIRRAVPHQPTLERWHRQQRQIHHADMFFRQFSHQWLVDKEVKGFGARAISGA